MFGDRLKLARKKAGYSLRALSDAMNGRVSAQAIGKYERGEMMPTSRVLGDLADALDCSIEFLMSQSVRELDGVEFRKKSGTRVRDRNVVEAAVVEHVEPYIAVEEILELDSSAWHAPECANTRVHSLEEAEQLADQLRADWNLGVDPIPDMTELLERHGIKVLSLDLPMPVSGLRCDVVRTDSEELIPVIVVNRLYNLERRRLTLAHELGHLVMDNGSPCDHEKAAQRFAGAFLVNRGHLIEEVGNVRHRVAYTEIMRLKRRYRVSAAAFLMRLRDIGILDQSRVVHAFRTYARTWRTSEPEQMEPEDRRGQFEAPRRFKRLCLRAFSEDLIGVTRATELLNYTRHELAEDMTGPELARANSRQ